MVIADISATCDTAFPIGCHLTMFDGEEVKLI